MTDYNVRREGCKIGTDYARTGLEHIVRLTFEPNLDELVREAVQVLIIVGHSQCISFRPRSRQ